MLGVWPGPFTLRALLRMAEYRLRVEWNRTASVMALLANCHRGRGVKEFHPRDFHPMAKQEGYRPRGMKMTPDNLSMIAKLITGKDPPAT